jgi:hypothetical protein
MRRRLRAAASGPTPRSTRHDTRRFSSIAHGPPNRPRNSVPLSSACGGTLRTIGSGRRNRLNRMKAPDSGGSCGRLITCSENELGGSKKPCLRNMSERSVCDSRIMSTVFGYWHREVSAPAGSSFLGLGVVRDWARQIGSRVDVYPCSALWQRPLLAQDATQSSIARLPEAGVRQGAWLRVRGRSGQGFGPKQNPLGGNQSSRQRPA